MEAEDVFLCFYLFILIFLSRFYLTFFILFYPYLSSREESFLIVIPNCASPELRLARIALREYAVLFAALKRTN